MTEQLRVLETVTERLKQLPGVHSIVLNGSVAYGAATAGSDLDLLVLCGHDAFEADAVDGVWVEIHFHRCDALLERLSSNPAEIYRYHGARAISDDGTYARLAEAVRQAEQAYRPAVEALEKLRYWLSSTQKKLSAAISAKDNLRMAYLLSTNTWKVLEGLYAINGRPVPPSSLAYHLHSTLRVPCEGWFEGLLLGDVSTRAEMMLRLITCICDGIDQPQ